MLKSSFSYYDSTEGKDKEVTCTVNVDRTAGIVRRLPRQDYYFALHLLLHQRKNDRTSSGVLLAYYTDYEVFICVPEYYNDRLPVNGEPVLIVFDDNESEEHFISSTYFPAMRQVLDRIS